MLDGFYKSRTADAAFTGYQFAAFGGGDFRATPAVGSALPLMGIADSLPVKVGQQVDVQMTQIAEIIAGGTVTAGDRLTSDANGHAVTAVKIVGATVFVGGIAQTSGVAGDVIQALVHFGSITG